MNQGEKVFVSCALGTMLGTLVSILLGGVIWWLGAFVGGTFAAVIYAWSEIVHFAPVAARVARRSVTFLPREYLKFLRLSESQRWYVSDAIMVSFETVFGALLAFGATIIIKRSLGEVPRPEYWFVFFSGLNLLMAALIGIIAVFANYKYQRTEEERLKLVRGRAILASPFALFYLVGLGFWRFVKNFRSIIALVWESLVISVRFSFFFLDGLFWLVHSKEMVLCFGDAIIGVIVSYLFFFQTANLPWGGALVLGGLAGGLIGLAHYHFVRDVLHLKINGAT